MPPDSGRGRPDDGTTSNPPPPSSEISTIDPGAPSAPGVVVLPAYRSAEGQLWVWCDHEQLWHRHGGCRCPSYCSDDFDGLCRCEGTFDGHRVAHCRCARSPYKDDGYELREVGDLTDAILADRREASYLRGCREGSCRLDRLAHEAQMQAPTWLPGPDDPLAVAHQIVKGYVAIDWTDEELWDRRRPMTYVPAEGEDEEDPEVRVLRGHFEPADELPESDFEYDPRVNGPLALRRWRGAWMRWHVTHWAEVDDAEINAELYERLGGAHWVKRSVKAAVAERWKPNRRTVGEVAAALESLSLLPSKLEAPTWLPQAYPQGSGPLVACANGLLDTTSRQLYDHDPGFFNLVSVPFDYDLAAPTPRRWLAFLEQLWPGDPDSVAALQEWFGYVLSGRTDLQKLFLIVGPPRSGKGTIARILQELVGRGHYAGPTLASLGTNFGLQALIGKPLAIVADARLGGKDTHTVVERLLSISGEDTLTIDRKYRDPWTGRLPTRVMVLSNELPHFGDASGAIATRFVALMLTTSWLGKEDIGLERALHAELPGILAWALDGLTRLTEQRRFSEPASSAEAMVAMHDSASPTSAFVRDRCTVGAGNQIPAAQLFAAWRGWCLDNGREHPGNQQTFGRTLRSVVPTVRTSRPRDPVTGQQVLTYDGITLSSGEQRSSYLSVQSRPFLPGVEG